MKRVVSALLCGLFLLLLNACEFREMEKCFHDQGLGECRCDPWCQDDDRDDYTDDTYYGQCQSDADCQEGEVCDPYDQCVPVVMNCPLTPECLADPEGYTPEWQGIDPVFVGSFSGDAKGRVRLVVDFYEDHLYGEAEAVLDGRYEWYYVTITGSVDGNQIFGQAVDPWGDRRFDAVFKATLLSASEMQGTYEVASDQGTSTGEFVLFRTSPCGCDIEEEEEVVGCTQNADCAAGEVCLDGKCQQLCFEDADCPEGQTCEGCVCVPVCPYECCANEDCAEGEICLEGECVPDGTCGSNDDCNAEEVCLDGACTRLCREDADCPDGYVCNGCVCVPGCPGECCEDADCPEGDVCVENTCKTPCTHRCECDAGEVCENGFCQIPEEEPPKECQTDCDCDYAAGERCIDGLCQMPSPG